MLVSVVQHVMVTYLEHSLGMIIGGVCRALSGAGAAPVPPVPLVAGLSPQRGWPQPRPRLLHHAVQVKIVLTATRSEEKKIIEHFIRKFSHIVAAKLL